MVDLNLGKRKGSGDIELQDSDSHPGAIRRDALLQPNHLGFAPDFQAERLLVLRADVHFQPQMLAQRKDWWSVKKRPLIADIARLGADEGGTIRLKREFFHPDRKIHLAPQGGPPVGRGGNICHALAN